MIILGVILIILGYTIAPAVLASIGWVLVVIGLILFILGSTGHYSGRRLY